jgi:hypothetical protein
MNQLSYLGFYSNLWGCASGHLFFLESSANYLVMVGDEALRNLMMSWYYAGYYTGLYEGQQQRQRQQREDS